MATRRFRLSRRTFLRGVGASSVMIALPPREAMFNANGTAYAAGATPFRLVSVFWPHGTFMDRWTPSTDGTTYALTPDLICLGGANNPDGSSCPNVKADVNVLTGLQNGA